MAVPIYIPSATKRGAFSSNTLQQLLLVVFFFFFLMVAILSDVKFWFAFL